MEKRRSSPIRTVCSDRGWVLIYTLVFCVVIQGVALIVCSLITYNLKSGTTFLKILSQRHISAETDGQPSFRSLILDAPEGWDHACFMTEVTEKTWGKQCWYSWRIRMKEQPHPPARDMTLSGFSPHIILLVDDGQDMFASCGGLYEEGGVYLEKQGGEIVPALPRDDVNTRLTLPEGTYFCGGYGNAWYQALDLYLFGGTMQCWTHIISSLKRIIDEMDMCPIAVATVSGGIIQPFTTDRAKLLSALDGLRPHSTESRLSEALFDLIDAFPPECSTSNHIIVATDGVAVHDGNIPSWLQDYDNDDNPQDRAIDEAGSHCLDDVASYAWSQGIRVHAIGPDIPFLRGTVLNGGGAFMPASKGFDPPEICITLPRCLLGDLKRFLTNRSLAFGPSWLDLENTSYFREMANDPPHLCSSSAFPLLGCARFLFADGGTLFCSTSRDRLLSIDMVTGAGIWMIEGVGGRIVKRDDLLIVGPDIRGEIAVLDNGPAIRWLGPGDLYAASEGTLYTARGASITASTLKDGFFEAQYTADNTVCALEYDPCHGVVLAASLSGMISILGQDLVLLDLLVPGLPGEIRIVRSFHWKRNLHVIAVTKSDAACMSLGKVIWRTPVEIGTCTNAVVMDCKLYLCTWEPGGCGGVDTGSSSLVVLDALTGEPVSQSPLFEAHAFGPLIDPASGIMEHTNWDMAVHETDISDLPGIRPVNLGMRLEQDPGAPLP